MKSTPIISIIIPVYNVEKYLERCVTSIVNQTYKNLDIILVDDGSPDNCPQICDELASKDNRIRVIHKQNGGLSSARNAALNEGLLGEYVTFVDSDDWLELDFISYCYNLILLYKADIVQLGVYITDSEDKKQNEEKEIIDCYSGNEIIKQLLIKSSWSVWGALYNTKVLGSIRFREGKINEDIDYKYKVLRNANRMVYSSLKKYYYFQSGDTISMGGLKRKDFDLYDAAEELYKLTNIENDDYIRFLGKAKKARTAFSLLCKIAFYGIADPSLNKKGIVKSLSNEHRSNLGTLLKAPIPLSRKCLAILLAINYYLGELIVKTVKLIPSFAKSFFK